jgi:hypothetical protein
MSSGRERLRLWALVLSRVELPLGAQTDPPFLGGGWVCAAQGGRGIFPDARQGRPGVAGRHPRTSQPGGITDRGKDDVHGSSLCGSCRHTWSLSPGRGLAGAARIIGSGGVSLSFGNCRLTRSNHRSYAGMSGKEVVDSQAKGRVPERSFQHKERSPGTRRLLCGIVAHNLCCFSCGGWNSPLEILYHIPLGYTQGKNGRHR